MYYNEEVKNWYLSVVEKQQLKSINEIRRVFKNTCFYEEKLNKDVSNWNIQEISSYYRYLSTSSIDQLINWTSILRIYTRFCLNQGLVKVNQNYYDMITNDMLEKFVSVNELKQKIISREELLNHLKQLDNPSDCFILLGCFEGIKNTSSFNEFSGLKTSDIKGNTIRLNSGRIIQISDELKRYAFHSAEEYTYYSLTENKIPKALIGDPDVIIKQKSNSINIGTIGYLFISNSIKRLEKYLGLQKVTQNSLFESGRIDFIKREMKRYNVTAEEYLKSKTLRKGMEEQYGPVNLVKKYLSQKGEYLK